MMGEVIYVNDEGDSVGVCDDEDRRRLDALASVERAKTIDEQFIALDENENRIREPSEKSLPSSTIHGKTNLESSTLALFIDS